MPVLASGNPVPRYARLAQLLRQRIDKGVWKPGEQLPRLEDLMQEFDVARVTVRQVRIQVRLPHEPPDPSTAFVYALGFDRDAVLGRTTP